MMNGKDSRVLETSWIDAFLDYTSGLKSPKVFRLWSAISAVGAALERKVWVKSMGTALYPHMYISLIGDPGVGKTAVISVVERIWPKLSGHHISPTSMTRASFVDHLAGATRKIVRPTDTPPVVEFNSLYIVARELAVLLPTYEPSFINALTDVFDNGRYDEAIRTGNKRTQILNPQVSILAGCTPSHLQNHIPEGAWDQGFMSRMVLIFSGEEIFVDIFADRQDDEKLFDGLCHDFKIIGNLYGQMFIEEEVKQLIMSWARKGMEPAPDHPRLRHYNQRRLVNFVKLCTIASVSRSDSLHVTIEDYQTAQGWLLEAEFIMPDIFRAMTSGGDVTVMDNTWHWMFKYYAKMKAPVPEHAVIHELSKQLPGHSVLRVFDVMQRSGRVRVEIVNGKNCFVPIRPA